MQAIRAKKKKPYPCPVPEYMRDMQIKKVADFANCSYDEAETMLHRRPARFYRQLGWCHVNEEVESVAAEAARAKSKSSEGGKTPQTLETKE